MGLSHFRSSHWGADQFIAIGVGDPSPLVLPLPGRGGPSKQVLEPYKNGQMYADEVLEAAWPKPPTYEVPPPPSVTLFTERPIETGKTDETDVALLMTLLGPDEIRLLNAPIMGGDEARLLVLLAGGLPPELTGDDAHELLLLAA